jgi:protein-tyrosine phosphatase
MSSAAIPADVLLPPTLAGAARAGELLAAGKLVVVPTETVYGVALSLLSDPARQAAHAIRQASAGTMARHWVLHVATPEEALSWVPGVSAMGRRLITKALPGPVSFQVKLSAPDAALAARRLGAAAPEVLVDGFLTMRCPDFPVTQDVLAAAKVPVAIIGAGTPGSGNGGVFELSDLSESVASQVAGAIDGGPTRYRKPSTVVRLDADGGGTFSVVRAGVIDERIIQKLADFTILFVCSGNTCRSPMAAALATRFLADRLKIQPDELPLRHVVVQSAGVHAQRGIRAAREAMDTVKSFGADLSGHFSQPATPDVLRRADVIYTMTDAHRDEILDLYPGLAAKTQRLDPDGDVPDPIGAGLQAYRDVAQRLAGIFEHRLGELPL